MTGLDTAGADVFAPIPPFRLRVAADYIVTVLGGPADPRVKLALSALRAGWLTPAEAASLEPLAAAIAYMAELDLPPHRGRHA